MTHPPADALLDPQVSDEVAQHLARCPRCRVRRKLHLAALDAPEETDGLDAARSLLTMVRTESLATLGHALDVRRTPLEPGAQVDGWRVEARIGAGALATVWRVRELATGHLAALKVIDGASGSALARVPREAETQAELRHPNLVPVLAVLDVDGTPALLLELVPGPTLQEVIAADVLPLPERLSLGLDLIRGVTAIHRANLVHRDLKPSNVLVDPRGGRLVARVADFGLVKDLRPDATRLTRTGSLLGTPAYMAPEQLRDAAHVDTRADLFATGAVLFELVTGRPPFRGPLVLDLFEQILSGDRPAVSDLAPELPEGVAAAIEGALHTDPEQRLGPAEALEARWREACSELVAPAPEVVEAVRALALDRPVHLPTLRIPARSESLVGRDDLHDALVAKIEAGGVQVTLTGPRGIGRRSLARAVAAELAPYLAGGVLLVEVGGLDEASVRNAVRDALPSEPPLAELGHLLMVWLDAEGDAVRALAGELAELPHLRLLCTAAAPLGLDDERVVPVPPLSAAEALELWVRLGGDRPELVEGCEGFPLGLEIAAACARLDPEVRAARGVAGWVAVAHELVSDEARGVLDACRPLPPGFTVDALIDALPEVDPLDVEDGVAELTELGLLRTVAGDGMPQLRVAFPPA